MKQFLTLCMAAAMIASATNADAKLTLEQAQMLKSEGKAMTAPLKAHRSNEKSLRQVPVSGFHKMKAIKDAASMKKAPMKAAPNGDSLLGYVGYCADTDAEPLGLYDFEGTTPSLKWVDPMFAENQMAAMNLVKVDDKVVAVYLDMFWGMIFGVYYAEYNFETGEVLNFVEVDLQNNPSFFQTFAYNEGDQRLYGYGSAEGEQGFISAPVDDPSNATIIRPYADGESICMSFCYNPLEECFYGVNIDYNFVKVGTDGVQEVVMPLDVFGGATYITGMVYNPASNLYYWNINLDDDVTSLLATIDPTTQELDVVGEFENSEEIMSFFTLDEANPNPLQPCRPTAGTPDFYQGNLIGSVPFTLPTENKGGDKYEGDLNYSAYLNGELYSTGSAAAGSEVKVTYAVPEPGTYSFSLTVSVDSLESSAATARAWVGNDVPVAAWDVQLTPTNVSWSYYPTKEDWTGIHGGYVDKRKAEYTVTIYKAGAVYEEYEIKDNWKANSQEIALPQDEELAAYVATVKVSINGYDSSLATSNYTTAGVGLTFPESGSIVIEPTEEQFAICTTLDNNGDGKGWFLKEDNYGDLAVYSNWDSANDMDEWLFLPKMTFDDPSKFYTFSFDAALNSSYYPEEYLEVLLCNEASPRGVLMPCIVDEFAPVGQTYETKTGYFRVRQPGDYYIAIHCLSAADQWGVYVRNFVVSDEGISLQSPGTIDNFYIEAAENGELKANVEFTMPELTLGEVEIDADTVLEARITSNEDEVKVTGKPGERINTTIETAQGYNTIEVRVYDGEKAGLPVSDEVYTGWNMPSTITGFTYAEAPDMLSMTMTWDPVTTGWISEEEPTEGIVNPETVVYDVYQVEQSIFGSTFIIEAEGITEPTYTFVAEEPGYYTLVVVSRNEAGSTGLIGDNVAYGILGKPYTLPMEENFDNEGNMDYQPWMIYSITPDNRATWTLGQNSNLTGDKEDTNWSIYATANEGAISRLGVPRFNTVGLENVSATFDMVDVDLPKITVYAEVYGEEPEVIGEITAAGKTVIALPAKFMDKAWVGILIESEFTGAGQVFAMDAITVESTSAVGNVNISNLKITAGKGQIKVAGLNGQDVTVANTNGAIVGKAVKASNDAIFDVEKGIYVVKAGNKKAKVVVK